MIAGALGTRVPTIPLVFDELATVVELFTHEGFLLGLAAGLVMLGLFYAASLFLEPPLLGWGVALAGAVLLLLSLDFDVDPALAVGLGGIALAGALLDMAHGIDSTGWRTVSKLGAWALLALAVFWFSTSADPPGEAWIGIALPLVIMLIGAAVHSFREGQTAELIGPMLLVTIGGIWVTVPETDMIVVLLGVAVPMGLATLAPVRARPSASGAFALAGLLVWLTVAGGETRPVSIVGGWASIGVIPLVSLMDLFRLRRSPWIVVFGLHAAFVILITRVVDNWDSIAVGIGALVALNVLSFFGLTAAAGFGGAEDVAEARARIVDR